VLAAILALATLATLPTAASAYYHARLGRFIQRDPIGYVGGDENLYRYVLNRPVGRTDPSGQAWWNLWICDLGECIGEGVGTLYGDVAYHWEVDARRREIAAAKLERGDIDALRDARRAGDSTKRVMRTLANTAVVHNSSGPFLARLRTPPTLRPTSPGGIRHSSSAVAPRQTCQRELRSRETCENNSRSSRRCQDLRRAHACRSK